MTLYDYYAHYAPTSDNAAINPTLATSEQYAEEIAKALGVEPTIKIKTLL